MLDHLSDQLLAVGIAFDLDVAVIERLVPVTDAAVTVSHADGAVMVVRFGKVTRNQVATAVRSLEAVDARLLGCVLTMTPTRGEDGYEAYGYEYVPRPGERAIEGESRPDALSAREVNVEGAAGNGSAGASGISRHSTAPPGMTSERGSPGVAHAGGDTVDGEQHGPS